MDMKVAITSDIAGNLVAFKAFRVHVAQYGVKAFLSCGNTVGYGPKSPECWQETSNMGFRRVQGEMEQLLGAGTFPCPISDHKFKMLKFCIGQMSRDALKEMALLNRTERYDLGDGKMMLMAHSSVIDETSNVKVNDTLRVQDEFDMLGSKYDRANIVVLGNNTFPIFIARKGTHINRSCDRFGRKFFLKSTELYLLNPGSIGRPITDEMPDDRGRIHFTYAILCVEGDDVSVMYHRVLYDPSEHIQSMRDMNFPDVYINQFLR